MLTKDTPTIITNSDAAPHALKQQKVYELGKFHVTADNHYCGEQGYGLTCITCCNCTLKSICKKYCNLTKQKKLFWKVLQGNPLQQTIITVKQVEATDITKSYTHILKPFKFTGTTNNMCVSALEKDSNKDGNKKRV